MKILLISLQNSASRPGYRGLYLPFGMAYISAVLENNGYFFDCIDLHTEEVLNEKELDSMGRIKQHDVSKYDVVAFGGTFLKFNILKLLSEEIWKVNKDIFQVVGGQLATNIPDIILKETRIKCVCLYEGEETIIELLNNIKNGAQWKRTKGIKYLNEEGQVVQMPIREKVEDLDMIPFPDRENWSFDIIRKAFPYGSPGRYSANIFGSRGCPFLCVFCNPASGRKIRCRSPENIIEEIKYLKRRWNIGYVRFHDEVFLGHKEKIRKLCDLMIEGKLNIFWWCTTQVKLVDEELLKIMKRAGCIEIAYGVESGNNTILSEMKKGTTRELSKRVIETTYKVGIRPSLNLLAGMPSENYETLRDTRDFVVSLNHIDWTEVPSIDFIVPLPNTELYKMATEKGLIADEKKYLTRDLYKLGKHTRTINLTNMTDDDFLGFVKSCNREIARDYYSRHPWKRMLSIVGFDHLRLDLIFRNFSFKQIKPIIEALLWVTLGKRDNFLSKYVNRFIYKRDNK